MLLVILPFSFILRPILVDIDTKTMGLICFELTDIDIPCGMPESPLTPGHVALPLTLVYSSILTNIDSIALTCVIVIKMILLRLAFVLRSIFHLIAIKEYQLWILN